MIILNAILVLCLNYDCLKWHKLHLKITYKLQSTKALVANSTCYSGDSVKSLEIDKEIIISRNTYCNQIKYFLKIYEYTV